ncbi:MAG: hypothetical protein LUD72_06180 [Bacteroidales bacterium]|nr:hypothetical protein [Bacteroidales bacterium]
MDRHRIRLNKKDSAFAVDKNNTVDVELRRTAKLFPYNDVRETLDQYEVYQEERRSCDKYRIILTIKPYCSNVLFNALTEIIKNEGSKGTSEDEKTIVITDTGKASFNSSEVQGATNPTRNQMVMNTEYSKDDLGYEYHPGYDIFNNHIIRNLTFKLVNKKYNGNDNKLADKWEGFIDEDLGNPVLSTQRFNTIGDSLRDKDGNPVIYSKRTSIDDASNFNISKHLYNADDLLGFENGDAINECLREDHGWLGFKNGSVISAKERSKPTNAEWNDMDISRVLNNYDNCEFIDMYPDRTLYSFSPKYNMRQHRPEYNWNIVLTYPYRNDYSHPIVSNVSTGDGETNALLLMSMEKMDGTGSSPILLCRTYTKHNLSAGDRVFFYYSKNDGETFERTGTTYKVNALGDLEKNSEDYYFQLTDLGSIEEILGDDYWYSDTTGRFKKTDKAINKALADVVLRITHVVGGIESEYYLRVFRRLPNMKGRKYNLTEEIAEDREKYEDFTKNVVGDNGLINDFAKEQYQLAFAETVYNDDCTQVAFTDYVDIEYLTDNLGRPLTEFYATIVKNNKGYDKWYGEKTYSGEDIEFSHCFGKVTSGLDFHAEKSDNTNTSALSLRGAMSDVGVINNLNLYESRYLDSFVELDKVDKENGNISYEDNEFTGDIVEFIPSRVQEVTLSDVCHRFNTAQREIKSFDKTDPEEGYVQPSARYSKFQYQEITADDFDLSKFTITNTIMEGSDDVVNRPEGYYYKPHCRIQAREFSSINQAAHYEVKVRSAQPIQNEGIYVQITSSRASGVAAGDKIFICDDSSGEWYVTDAVYVIDRYTFVINPLSEMNWIKLCDILNNTEDGRSFTVRRQNKDIPSYATKVGKNKFLWKDVIKVGEMESTLDDTIFANGYFYILKDLNFFLRRQDALGTNGLYAYAKDYFPNDLAGNIDSDTTYDYEDMEEMEC